MHDVLAIRIPSKPAGSWTEGCLESIVIGSVSWPCCRPLSESENAILLTLSRRFKSGCQTSDMQMVLIIPLYSVQGYALNTQFFHAPHSSRRLVNH